MTAQRSGALAALLTILTCLATSPAGASSTPAPSLTSDRATAQAINLTSADLPGWQTFPNPSSPSDQSLNAQMSACAGGPAPRSIDVIDVSSPNFDQGQIELNSDVTMVKTHRDGLADLHADTGHRAMSCFRQIFPPFLKKQIPGVTLSNLRASDFKPTESVPGAFGIQFAVTISGKAQNGQPKTLHFTGREIGFLVDTAEVTFGEDFTGSPTPVSNEASLVGTLYQRAIRDQSS